MFASLGFPRAPLLYRAACNQVGSCFKAPAALPFPAAKMSVSTNSVELSNGRSIPVLGLGTWNPELQKANPNPDELTKVTKAVAHALKCGYRHIDAAAFYGNEKEVGAGIKESGVARDELFITSKLWNTKHHPEDVEEACRKTLANLGLEYLDLYLIHWPHAYQRGEEMWPKNTDGTIKYDVEIDYVDTWLAMEKLLDLGLTKSLGISNFNSEQVKRILENGTVKPVTNQVECHPYLNQAKLMAFCAERGITLTAYSPLGSPGGPWATPEDAQLLDDVKIKAIAEKHNKSPAQVVLRWQVQRGAIVIPKSVTPSRIQENGNIFDFNLSKEEMKHIDSFDCNGRIIDVMRDHPHYPFNIEF